MKKNLKLLIGGLVENEYIEIIDQIRRFLINSDITNQYQVEDYAIKGSCAIAIILDELVTRDLAIIKDEADKAYILMNYTKLLKPNDLDIILVGSYFNNRVTNMDQKLYGFKKTNGRNLLQNIISDLSEGSIVSIKDPYFSNIDLVKGIRVYKNSIVTINELRILSLNKLISLYSSGFPRKQNFPSANGTGIDKKQFLIKLKEILEKYPTLKSKYINPENNNN